MSSDALEKVPSRPPTLSAEPILVVQNLRVAYKSQTALRSRVDAHVAVDDVSFIITRGTSVGLIGESGSGKSTIAKCVLGLVRPDGGTVKVNGQDIARTGHRGARQYRRRVQIVFQNPDSCLDPRMRIGQSIAEPLAAYRIGTEGTRRERVAELLQEVGLDPGAARHRPEAFSGGERQRIAIARALALEPDLIVCDEPVSALDLSIQAQIMNLLRALQQRREMSYLFIAHDLAVVRAMSDEIIVLHNGRIVESGPAGNVCDAPREAYTKDLLAAARAVTNYRNA